MTTHAPTARAPQYGTPLAARLRDEIARAQVLQAGLEITFGLECDDAYFGDRAADLRADALSSRLIKLDHEIVRMERALRRVVRATGEAVLP
jgi:hypothetical protein